MIRAFYLFCDALLLCAFVAFLLYIGRDRGTPICIVSYKDTYGSGTKPEDLL